MNKTIPRQIWQVRENIYAITDTNLIIQEINGPWETIENSPGNCVGRSLLEFVPELVGSEQLLADILAGKSANLKLDLINRETIQGETRYLIMEELPCLDEAGHISGIIHFVQDVTERARITQELFQDKYELRYLQDQVTRQNLELAAANTELLRLAELKSQFISIAAHELRTPLSSILGFLEMLLDGKVGRMTDAQHEYLEMIQKSGHRLLALTNELLDVTRLEAGYVDLELQPVDLKALVEAVTAEYGAKLQAKNQSLNLEFSQPLPLALCDETRAAQIVTNLLSNANKYTPEGGSICIRVQPAGKPGYIQLSVADTGVGVLASEQSRLFDPWFRTNQSISIKADGAGLGLYITRSLVELHGGSIWYESNPGQGSIFNVTFLVAS